MSKWTRSLEKGTKGIEYRGIEEKERKREITGFKRMIDGAIDYKAMEGQESDEQLLKGYANNGHESDAAMNDIISSISSSMEEFEKMEKEIQEKLGYTGEEELAILHEIGEFDSFGEDFVKHPSNSHLILDQVKETKQGVLERKSDKEKEQQEQ